MGTISEAHKEALRAARRREADAGKLPFGGAAGRAKARESTRTARAGRTYLDIYGPARAAAEVEKRRAGNVGAHADRQPHPNRGAPGRARRGKTYAAIYGEERAAAEAAKRAAALSDRMDRVGRKNDQRPKHNGEKKYGRWRTTVFERDAYTCQGCGEHGGKLNAHHYKSWSRHPELRYELDNGVTFCERCHAAWHRANGRTCC